MTWNDLRQLSYPRMLPILALCSTLTLVNACGFDWGGGDDGGDGNDGGSPTEPGPEDLPEGNDGGSSIALLTSKDRIRDFEISYDSTLNVSNDTVITVDGVTASVDDLQDGMILRMKFDSDSNDPDNQNDEPTTTEISVTHMLIGPITSQNPLRVMGREVIVTEDTYLANVFNQREQNDIRDGVAALAIDSQVKISGYLNSNNTILATRVEPGSFDSWQMVGTVESIADDNSTLDIGGVSVNLADLTAPTDCSSDRISLNNLIVINATPTAVFSEDEGLGNIDSIRCSSHLQLPELFPEDNETTSSLPAEIEGFITSFNGSEFFVNQQAVRYDNLSPLGGRPDDIRVGALVEVEGNFDLFTRTLVASNIKFHQRRIYARAPVTNTNANTETNTFSILGISFDLTGLRIPSNNPSSEDIANGTLAEDSTTVQAEIYGFVDQENNPYLIGIENQGRANFEAFELMGPIDDESTTNPQILQVTIDLDSNGDNNTPFEEDSLWRVINAERDQGTGDNGQPFFTLRDNNNDITETSISPVSTTTFFTENSFNRQSRN